MVVPACGWEANISIQELKEMYWPNVTGSPVQIGLNEQGDSVIVRGRVASSDEAGNVYNSIILQDEDGQYAINFYVSYSDSYRHYKFGEEVAVNLTGMYAGGYNGLMQFGAVDAAGAMATMKEEFFKVQARPDGWPEPEKVDTVVCTMDDILGATTAEEQMKWQSRLVRIKDMTLQDQGQPWAETSSTNRYAADDKGQRMLMRISNYATFKNSLIPTGKGDIVGVLSYYNDWQLVPIDSCAFIGYTPAVVAPVEPLPEANTTIAALKTQYWDNGKSDYVSTIAGATDADRVIIEGTVISSDEAGNVYKSLVVADETAAVLFAINDNKLYSYYKIGQKLRVDVTGMNIGRYRNLMQIGAGSGTEMGRMELGSFRAAAQPIGEPEQFSVQPKVTTIPALNAALTTQDGMIQWQSQLVRIEGVHFPQAGETFVTGNENTNRDLADAAGASIVVRTSSYASFASEKIPVGTGNVTAIVSQFNTTPQLTLINSDGCANFDGVPVGGGSGSTTPDTPTPVPGATLLEVSFQDGTLGGFTVENKTESSWNGWRAQQKDNSPSCAIANSYVSGTNIAAESWLVSPEVQLGNDSWLTFSHAFGFYFPSEQGEFCVLRIQADGGEWEQIPITTYPAKGNDRWTKFVECAFDLSKYNGKTVKVAFCYKNDGNQSVAWEIQDFKLTGNK